MLYGGVTDLEDYGGCAVAVRARDVAGPGKHVWCQWFGSNVSFAIRPLPTVCRPRLDDAS